jgi:C4-dicarboxylate-specific signal transduction histidine kinase
MLSSFRRDQRNYAFNSGDLIASVTSVASVPVYGVARNWIGDGIVGGAVLDYATEGMETARMLETVLRRAPNEPLPPYQGASNPLIVDARQLQRWDLPLRRLPAGVQIVNREASLWQRHKTLVLATAGVLLAQLALIMLLLLERTKRRRAQRDVEQTRGQVTHMARVATFGQITAAVAHELRQPLTAIHATAQAGALLLRKKPTAEAAELRDIFGSILSADERAMVLIDEIRGFLRNQGTRGALVDMNQVCQRVVRLLNREVAARSACLKIALDPALSFVRGDEVQLQQVVINLVMNALDAVAAEGDRRVTMTTRDCRTHVELSVRNSGAPLSPEVQANLFSAFFSTKSHGLGMGLAIVRMIVERHHGSVQGSNHPEGGVVFSVTLPKAESMLPSPPAAPPADRSWSRSESTPAGAIPAPE